MKNLPDKPEFSRPVYVEDIGPDGCDRNIEASANELESLRERLGLLSLEFLMAELHLVVAPSGISIKVSGRYKARFSQECVVSLEPVASDLDEVLEAEFGPAADEIDVSMALDEPEPVEPLVDGRIDLGELVVQHLAMALDPYPRKAGAKMPEFNQLSEEYGDNSKDSPFSVLAALRKKD